MENTLSIVKDKFKELPNNIEAEQAVIGSILVSNDIFDEINTIISSINFYDPMHQKIFEAIEKKYPLSNEAVQAQIMSGFIDYLTMEYESAIFKFNRIIQKYPSHKNIDYVYYMKAICYFEQISHEELDNNSNIQSLKSFNQILTRFPNSEYAKDSKMKIVLVKENMAAKHMDVGRFYMENNKFMAAMNRFKKVIDEYSTSKFTPEALYRLVEIYYKLGMIEDSKKTASVIAYNYPDSKWYNLSYQEICHKFEDNI